MFATMRSTNLTDFRNINLLINNNKQDQMSKISNFKEYPHPHTRSSNSFNISAIQPLSCGATVRDYYLDKISIKSNSGKYINHRNNINYNQSNYNRKNNENYHDNYLNCNKSNNYNNDNHVYYDQSNNDNNGDNLNYNQSNNDDHVNYDESNNDHVNYNQSNNDDHVNYDRSNNDDHVNYDRSNNNDHVNYDRSNNGNVNYDQSNNDDHVNYDRSNNDHVNYDRSNNDDNHTNNDKDNNLNHNHNNVNNNQKRGDGYIRKNNENKWITVPNKNKINYYICLTDKLDGNIFNKRMNEKYKNWQKVNLDRKIKHRVKFVVAEGKYAWDRRLYNIKTVIKSRLNVPILTNKIDLHILLMQRSPNMIPKTFVYPRDNDYILKNISFNNVWVWRPEGGYAGKGVHFINSKQKYKDILKNCKTKRALLSRYIKPMLYNEHKFHLRMFFMIVKTSEELKTYVFNSGLIAPAAKPYINGKYEENSIHDTRLRHKDIRFPRDFPKYESNQNISSENVFEEMTNILRNVSKYIQPHVKLYPESKSAFEIFGCDFMIDESGHVYLIEINFKPDFGRSKYEEKLWLSKIIFEGIFETAIDPLFSTHQDNPQNISKNKTSSSQVLKSADYLERNGFSELICDKDSIIKENTVLNKCDHCSCESEKIITNDHQMSEYFANTRENHKYSGEGGSGVSSHEIDSIKSSSELDVKYDKINVGKNDSENTQTLSEHNIISEEIISKPLKDTSEYLSGSNYFKKNNEKSPKQNYKQNYKQVVLLYTYKY